MIAIFAGILISLCASLLFYASATEGTTQAARIRAIPYHVAGSVCGTAATALLAGVVAWRLL